MSALDGFEVVETPADEPRGTTKYAELYDKALEAGPGKCVAKTFGSRREAASKAGNLRENLKTWSRREPRWKRLEVFYRDKTVYVHARQEEV